jgi:hypothetical protein
MHSHQRTLLAQLGFNDGDKKDIRHDRACQYLALEENAERLATLLHRYEHVPRPGPRNLSTIDHQEVHGLLWDPTESRLTVKAAGLIEVAISKGEGQYRTSVGFLDVVVRSRAAWHEWIAPAEAREAPPPPEPPLQPDGDRYVPRYDPSVWRLCGNGGCGGRAMLDLATCSPGLRCPLCNAVWPVSTAGAAPAPVLSASTAWPAPRPSELWFDPEWPREGYTKAFFQCRGFGNDTIAIEVKIGEVSIGDVLRQLALYRQHAPATHWVLASPWVPAPADLESLKSAGVHHIRLGPKFDDWCAAQREAPRSADSPEF